MSARAYAVGIVILVLSALFVLYGLTLLRAYPDISYLVFAFGAIGIAGSTGLMLRQWSKRPRTFPSVSPISPASSPETQLQPIREVFGEEITNKEVIVKIRCSYCHTLYDETLDRCPHCGGKN